MISASVKEKDTVYTCLKCLDKSFTKDLGQRNLVITFDEDLYAKAKQIQWAVLPELDHIIIKLVGFHRVKNFFSVIGRRMVDSGLEDIWLESGLYGSSMVSKITLGVHYNRAVRAHKVMLEALESLLWDAFTQWLENNNRLDRKMIDTLREKRQEVLIAPREVKQNLLNSEAKIQELFEDLATLLADLKPPFH